MSVSVACVAYVEKCEVAVCGTAGKWLTLLDASPSAGGHVVGAVAKRTQGGVLCLIQVVVRCCQVP